MANKQEEVIGIIPENERKPELEKQVQYYLTTAVWPKFVSKKRYTPNKYPTNFSSIREEEEYQLEEIRRLRYGYDGLSGKGYGWLNYAKLRDPEKGKISPQFRVRQEDYFQKVEEIQKAKDGRGVIGFKRRRWGFSWAGAWDDLHDSITKPFYQIGMNSKSENDSRLLFKNIKFQYQNLPEWLRPSSTASDRRDYMEFAWIEKDDKGNKIKKGLQSWISSVAPTDNAHEGQAYSKLRIDEGGKIPNLLTIYQYAEDCLRINTRRVGLFICMGTVGDIDKDGKGLMELYLNSDAYNLERFPVYGYHGLIVDEFGNDMIVDAIRWIIYERDRLKSATRKIREAFIQKYPLVENDAFHYVVEGGVGNPMLINEQVVKLHSKPPLKHVGWMRRKSDGAVDFVPDDTGKIIVYEFPDYKRIGGYHGAGDPADHDGKKKNRDTSELALVIGAKPFGLQPPKLVLEYCDRPEKLDKFFEQSAMALQWFNNTKVLLEDNRARMLNYFKTHYPHLLPLVPKAIGDAKVGYEMKNSVTMTPKRKEQVIGLMEDYIDHYSEFIPSIKLLEQHKVFGDDHRDDDLAIAWGLFLLMLQSDSKVKIAGEETKRSTVSYKNVNGIIHMVNNNKPVNTLRLPNHPLLTKRY